MRPTVNGTAFGNPVEPADDEIAAHEFIVRPDYDAVGVGMDGEDVPGLCSA